MLRTDILSTAFIGCLLCIVFAVPATGQIYYNKLEIPESEASDSLTFSIKKIEITGHNKTRDYVILRELLFAKNDTVSLKNLFLAQKRVLNLYLFNRVIFDLVGEDTRVILLITVAERWYFFPMPILYLNERSWHKVSYGAKILYYNFLGRDILLNLTMAFGYNPEIKLSYRNPWFAGPLRLMTNVSVFHKKVRSQSIEFRDFEDERSGVDWLIGRRFGHFFSTYVSLGYMQLSHPELTQSETGTDKLTTLSFHTRFDNRDLRAYPHEGSDIHLWVKRVQYVEPRTYYRYGGQLRHYIPFGAYTTLALRSEANIAHGSIPSYDRVFLGYGQRIRGQFYTKYEGENQLIGGIELRFPLRKITYFDIPEFAPPGFEDYYRNLQFGISLGIFYDVGAIWQQAESLASEHIHDGFGVGLHFHLPYVDTFRFELAFDRDFDYQFIGEVGVAF